MAQYKEFCPLVNTGTEFLALGSPLLMLLLGRLGREREDVEGYETQCNN